LVALALAACPVRAQQGLDTSAGPVAEALTEVNRVGVHFRNISFFGNYYENGQPTGVANAAAYRPNDFVYGASAAMGWVRTVSRVNVALNYSPTYTGRMRDSNLNGFGHDLNLHVGVQLNPKSKWFLTIGVNGALRDVQQSLFSAGRAAQIASTPATFNALASAMVNNQNANIQLASVLGTPAAANPSAAALLYGYRYLTAAVNLGMTYRHSERFQISFGGTGSRSQSVSPNPAGAAPPLAPHSTNGGVRASVAYGLTPRLNLSGNWTGQRSFQYGRPGSAYSGGIVHNTGGSLGYIAGTKWMFTVGGGMGFIPSTVRTFASGAQVNTPGGRRYLVSGSVVYRFFSHSLMASGSRSVSNAYGLGAGSVAGGDLAWHWTRPGSNWGLTANASYQSYEVQGGLPLNGWHGMVSLNRRLTRRLSISSGYSAMRNTGAYAATGVNYGLNRSVARVTLIYSFADQLGPGAQ
jgi:hypothetical protein